MEERESIIECTVENLKILFQGSIQIGTSFSLNKCVVES